MQSTICTCTCSITAFISPVIEWPAAATFSFTNGSAYIIAAVPFKHAFNHLHYDATSRPTMTQIVLNTFIHTFIFPLKALAFAPPYMWWLSDSIDYIIDRLTKLHYNELELKFIKLYLTSAYNHTWEQRSTVWGRENGWESNVILCESVIISPHPTQSPHKLHNSWMSRMILISFYTHTHSMQTWGQACPSTQTMTCLHHSYLMLTKGW